MSTPVYTDLLDVLGDSVPYEEAGYCDTRGSEYSNGQTYVDWERKVATPRLVELGYTVCRWEMGERDSFGPLSRYAVTVKNGVVERLVYG